jgi:xanthine dehydrogenase accessory factor
MYHQVKQLIEEGETLAIATIVSTLGSTPREVGAQMVVTYSGEILGTIGGGCGEAEVCREAVQVIRSHKPAMVKVELIDDIESDSPAVCGGILNVYIDPWWKDPDAVCPRLADELLQVHNDGAAAVAVTVVRAENCSDVAEGEKCLIRDGIVRVGNIRNKELLQTILQEADTRARREDSRQVSLAIPGTDCKVELFFQILTAVRKVIIVGAGHLAIPLVKFAKIL